MTQFTSFVAVEEVVVTDGGQPRRIDVPVEVPAGVNPDAIGGDYLMRKEVAKRSLSMASAGRLPMSARVIRRREVPEAWVSVLVLAPLLAHRNLLLHRLTDLQQLI
jgi:hypothetical protein